MELTHFDNDGNARMVDVSEKDITSRMARATGYIKVSKEVYDAITIGNSKKGDVLTVATTAGIMGAKKNSELIPMCHIIVLNKVSIEWDLQEDKERHIDNRIVCTSTVKCDGKTGVEMEALTAVSVALLTVYDMTKSIDKRMVISDIHLLEKDGGKSGHFIA